MYLICQLAVNKSQNGYLSPSQFNTAIQQAQVSYQAFLVGEFQQYQYGRSQSRISYSQNENIRQRLSVLIDSVSITINGAGVSSYPSDYIQVDSLRTADFKRIRYVNQDSLFSYYNSTIDPIATNPIYLIEDTGFQFYPLTLANAILSYIKDAPAIVWGYCLDSNGRPVYNPTAATTTTTTSAPSTTTTTSTTTTSSGCTQSVQPVWGDLDLLEIIARALTLIGVNLKDGDVQRYANQIITNGQ